LDSKFLAAVIETYAMTDQDTFSNALKQKWSETPGKKAEPYIEQFWARTRRGQKIIAQVKGNHGTYTVSIEVQESGLTRSSCSCYIGKHGYCHHVAALGYTYLSNPGSFTIITPIALEDVTSLDKLEQYLQTVTLEDLVLQLREKGVSQKAFAESIGMSSQKLGVIKRSEDQNRYFHELGAVKLACLWVLQNLTANK
jgi:hypothetical protein